MSNSEANQQVMTEVKNVENNEIAKTDEKKWCFARIQEARQRNRNDTYKCCSEVIQILCETAGVFAFFIFENLIGFVFLILGIYFINDCPIQKGIPISLIVFGAFSVSHGLTVQIVRSKCFDMNDERDGFATLAKVGLCFTSFGAFFSFIFVCVQVFGVADTVDTQDDNSNQYCQYFLFWFTFSFIILYMICGFILLLLICFFICFVLSDTPVLVDPYGPTRPTILVIHNNSPKQSN